MIQSISGQKKGHPQGPKVPAIMMPFLKLEKDLVFEGIAISFKELKEAPLGTVWKSTDFETMNVSIKPTHFLVMRIYAHLVLVIKVDKDKQGKAFTDFLMFHLAQEETVEEKQ